MASGEVTDEEEAYQIERLALAERMGWTLEYIDRMDLREFKQILTRLEAIDKGRAYRQREEAERGTASS